MTTFGKNLKEILKKRDMTQTKLGELTGIPQNQISGYINSDKLHPPIDRVELIADTLGVSIDALCGRKPDRPITAKQWFDYTVQLIDNPPTAPGFPRPGDTGEDCLITFDANKRTISFNTPLTPYGEKMRKFFDTYIALKESMRGTVDDKVFNDLVSVIFSSYEQLFTPGYRFGGDTDGKQNG